MAEDPKPKRRGCLTVLVCIWVVAGLAFGWFRITHWLNEKRVTWANYQKLKPGMPESEVHAMLGRPQERQSRFDRPTIQYAGPPVTREYWTSDRARIAVWFDASGGLTGMVFSESSPPNRSLWWEIRD